MVNYKDASIIWFRQDLRIKDNPALTESLKHTTVYPIYILDDVNARDYEIGSASKIWLHHSLNNLNKSLGEKLSIFRGDPKDVLVKIVKSNHVKNIYWNRCYEPWRIKRDKKIKKSLEDYGVKTHSSNGSLLWEPWEVLKADGTPYKVFTPFYRRGCLESQPPRKPLPSPSLKNISKNKISKTSISELNLIPSTKWYKKIENEWTPGEDYAHKKLNEFLKKGIDNYKEGRNFPSKKYVSQLSPYLHHGEISPNYIWYKSKETNRSDKMNYNLDHFLTELGWREFSYSLLYHFPFLPKDNLQKKFDKFPWDKNSKLLNMWKKGLTGYPIVDAGMRELWQTGYMHNRLRMIVGSFLVKNLLLHWHHGERWFWDCLVDADLASNSAGWQWIAGTGADAAPYFRIFNPITQGQKFDSNGEYTKKYIPELKNVPNKYLFNPWEAPKEVLENAKVKLGDNYPLPIVEIGPSRQKALRAFAVTKK